MHIPRQEPSRKDHGPTLLRHRAKWAGLNATGPSCRRQDTRTSVSVIRSSRCGFVRENRPTANVGHFRPHQGGREVRQCSQEVTAVVGSGPLAATRGRPLAEVSGVRPRGGWVRSELTNINPAESRVRSPGHEQLRSELANKTTGDSGLTGTPVRELIPAKPGLGSEQLLASPLEAAARPRRSPADRPGCGTPARLRLRIPRS